MNTLAFTVALLIGLKLIVEVVLQYLNRVESRRRADALPEPLASVMDAETYARSVAYTQARSRFATAATIWDAFWLCIILFTPCLSWLYTSIGLGMGDGLWAQALCLLVVMGILSLPDLAWDWWEQFRLEAAFGFNRSSLGTWMADKLKGMLLGLGLGFPLLWGLFGLLSWAGASWWLWGFAFTLLFSLTLTWLGPALLLPLFNKFEPMPEGPLKDRLMALAERARFQARSILVMDGSRRSGHANAFFTGFGRLRRIVLFDTLIEQLDEDELEAVLAHEIGHFRLHHIPQRLAVAAGSLLIGFAAIDWLLHWPGFVQAFGFQGGDGAYGPVFLLFFLLAGLVSFWTTPFFSFWSRRHEFEADRFARGIMGSADPLSRALRKLHRKNLGNLTPHPWYSRFYYSHPTLLERELSLRAE